MDSTINLGFLYCIPDFLSLFTAISEKVICEDCKGKVKLLQTVYILNKHLKDKYPVQTTRIVGGKLKLIELRLKVFSKIYKKKMRGSRTEANRNAASKRKESQQTRGEKTGGPL